VAFVVVGTRSEATFVGTCNQQRGNIEEKYWIVWVQEISRALTRKKAIDRVKQLSELREEH
jgi:hypothetical protein